MILFVSSPNIKNFLALVQRYKRLPSELMHISDPYTSYCFDEACGLILSKLDAGEEMVFKTHYKSFTDLYRNYA